jgi:hypothetical protein
MLPSLVSSPSAGSNILFDLSTKNKMFAGMEFPDPGGNDFAKAELVNVEMKRININRNNIMINL